MLNFFSPEKFMRMSTPVVSNRLGWTAVLYNLFYSTNIYSRPTQHDSQFPIHVIGVAMGTNCYKHTTS